MKKKPVLPFLFVVVSIIFAFLFYGCKTVSPPAKPFDMSDVEKTIASLQTYHVHLTAKLFRPKVERSKTKAPVNYHLDHFTETRSVVYGESGKKMKIITVSRPATKKIEMERTLLYDGTWLWIQQKVLKHPDINTDEPLITVLKVHIPSVSPDPVTAPFHTIYGTTGMGLAQYRDLPGTFSYLMNTYSFLEAGEKGEDEWIAFTGSKRDRPLMPGHSKAEAALKAFYDKNTRFAKLWVAPDSGLIKAYASGASEESPNIYTRIEYISVNEPLPSDTFTFNAPKGVVVKDITKMLLKKRVKKSGKKR